MKEPKSVKALMQELIPGSTTFAVRILCPCCGWHFKDGLTDPSGEHIEVHPNFLLVCGQCLRVLRSNAQCQFDALSKEEIAALPEDDRNVIAENWRLAYLSLMAVGPEPKGTPQ